MFSASEVQIYRYWNGCWKDNKPTFGFVDPIEVQINLEEHDPNYQQSFKTLFDLVQISKDADAAKEIVDLGRIMFNLIEPYDDGEKVIGLTTMGVMSIVLDYINWMNEIKQTEQTEQKAEENGIQKPELSEGISETISPTQD